MARKEMNLDDKQDRLPLPKWRALARTPSSELVSAGRILPNQDLALARAERMHALYERWQARPSIDNALELLDCSSFISDNALFYGPAVQIINSGDVTKTSKFVAQQVLSPDRSSPTPTYDLSNKEYIHKAISANRKRLQTEPQNSMLHSEQARLYAIIDEADAAERSFIIALAISPDNRHILRSFSRFMVHVGGPEKALQRLRRSNAIASDPWLQAAEIAISEQHNVGSQIARLATRNLDALRVRPEHISELATALATLERSVGNRKKFKKRFMQSLHQPSDNALAQASWLFGQSPEDISEEISDAILPTVDNSIEARTYTLLRRRKWKKAIQSYADWQREESFSSHIAIEGSFYAVSLAKDYEAAVSICKNGLVANSASHAILNNLCYAERRLGRVENAVKAMARLKSVYTPWRSDPVYLSTDGMLHFALGDYDAGRTSYREALRITDNDKQKSLRRRIKMHWLHEEAITGTLTEAQSEHLISALESSSGLGAGTTQEDDYWNNLKAEIEVSSATSSQLHVSQKNVPHILEQYI